MQPYEAAETPHAPSVDARTLWSGGAAAAVVAALVAIVGIVIARGLFGIPVLAPKGQGTFGDVSTVGLAMAAAVGALLATALIHMLLRFTPRPFVFFGWIMTLVTAVAVLVPFTAKASLAAQIATATINLLIGIAIGTLVSSIASRSIRRVRIMPGYGMPGVGTA